MLFRSRGQTQGGSGADALTLNKKGTPSIHKTAFGSPIPSNKHKNHSKEATPFASTPATKASKEVMGNTTPPVAREKKKLETVAGVENAIATSKEESVIKIVYRGSWFYTTLLFFLWIASSAVLGGLYLQEKLNNELRAFQFEQELLDSFPPIVDENTTDKKALLNLVEEYKVKAMESEAKLQGCKREFRDSLARLERK